MPRYIPPTPRPATASASVTNVLDDLSVTLEEGTNKLPVKDTAVENELSHIRLLLIEIKELLQRKMTE